MASKKDREIIFKKFDGKCAYCGCELQKGWHVDELLPCRRNFKYDEIRHYVWDGTYEHPERLHIDNQMPSCPSCNINKHSDTIEEFRHLIENFINSLNRDSTQYKIAKRYGLISENPRPVVFYFEQNKNSQNAPLNKCSKCEKLNDPLLYYCAYCDFVLREKNKS